MSAYTFKPIPNVVICAIQFLIFVAVVKYLYPVDWRPAVFALIVGVFFGLLETKAINGCATQMANATSEKEARQILANSKLSEALVWLIAIPAGGLGAWFGGSTMFTTHLIWMVGCFMAFLFAKDLVSMPAVFRLASLKAAIAEKVYVH